MATPQKAVSDIHRSRILGKTRIFFLAGLLALLVLCMIGVWATRGAMTNFAFLQAKKGAAAQSLVDLSPWQTAQTLASLAVTAEEIEYGRDAERLADHAVDQSFAAALREADLQQRHRVLTGRALALSQRVAQLQQQIAQDQATVAKLKASPAGGTSDGRGATANGAANSAASSDALKVAEAQLALDQDELADAQSGLDRVTGNLSVRLQDELASHEAAMKKYNSAQQNSGTIAVVSVKQHGTLFERLKAWFDQRSRYASIEQAAAETQSDAQKIIAEYNALEAKVNAAKASGSDGVTLSELEDRTTERQILSIDDDRIQTNQQLAGVYAKWGDQVLLQHRILLHLVLQSLEAIILIAMCMIAGDAVVRNLTERPSLDHKKMHTLQTILRVTVQLVGILLIVVVVFGPPHQTTTMIGLATAALTISLQDYILAFVGWFLLVGKNGIHVGDTVEINGVSGEVLDVGLTSTTLLETTGLAEKGQPTGRRVSFMNSFAIRGQYFNFSSKGQWMWDEIAVSVPADENLYDVVKNVEELAREETKNSAHLAEQEWKNSARSTSLGRMSAEPTVMLRPSGASGIDIQVRYVTRAAERSEVRDKLYRNVIKLLQEKGHSVKAGPADAAG